MPRFEYVTHYSCPKCSMCVTQNDGDGMSHILSQINAVLIWDETTVDDGKLQCPCGTIMDEEHGFVCGGCGSDSAYPGYCDCGSDIDDGRPNTGSRHAPKSFMDNFMQGVVEGIFIVCVTGGAGLIAAVIVTFWGY